jgi:hypothetical protein
LLLHLSTKVRKKLEVILCYQKDINNDKFDGGSIEGGDMPLLNEINNAVAQRSFYLIPPFKLFAYNVQAFPKNALAR